jgi:hypothetical protein
MLEMVSKVRLKINPALWAIWGQLNKFNSKWITSAGQDELIKNIIQACQGELESEISAIKADHSKCEETMKRRQTHLRDSCRASWQ